MKTKTYFLLFLTAITLQSCCNLYKTFCGKPDCKKENLTPPRITSYLDSVRTEPPVAYDDFGSAIEPFELVIRFLDPNDARIAGDVNEKIKYLEELGDKVAPGLVTYVTPCMCGDELLVIGLDNKLTRELGGVVSTGEKMEARSGPGAEIPVEASPNYIITDAQPTLSGVPLDKMINPGTPPNNNNQKPNEVIIAVLDTGIDVTAIDNDDYEEFNNLRNHLWTMPDTTGFCFNKLDFINDNYTSYDVVNNDNNPFDNHSHGTHVTGIITSQLELLANKMEVENINYKIMPIKTHDKDGIGTYFDVLCATYFAVKNGAHVINDSWGFYGVEQNNFMDDALSFAEDHGVFVVTALGNDQKDINSEPFLPSNFYYYSNVISVGAYDETNVKNRSKFAYSYSNYNSTERKSLLAPGTNIQSLLPGGRVGPKTGTSMAAPHVTAAIAFNLSQNKHANFVDMESFFYNSTITPDSAVDKDFILYSYDKFEQQNRW